MTARAGEPILIVDDNPVNLKLIWVLLKGEGPGPYRVGAVYLFVPADDEIRARALIDAFRSDAIAPAEDDVESASDQER